MSPNGHNDFIIVVLSTKIVYIQYILLIINSFYSDSLERFVALENIHDHDEDLDEKLFVRTSKFKK